MTSERKAEPDSNARRTSAARLRSSGESEGSGGMLSTGSPSAVDTISFTPGASASVSRACSAKPVKSPLLKEPRMRQRRRQKEIRIDFAPNGVSERVSVADQLIPLRFAFVMGDPSDHDQREDDEGQNDDKRRHAQTPAQRAGLGHGARPVSQILRKGKRLLLREASPPPARPARYQRPWSCLAACGPHRPSTTQSQRAAVAASCSVGATPRRASSLSGKRSGDCSNADDDPPLVIQDMDLLSSLAFELSHTENPTPNGFEVGRQMTLARQPRPIPADQAEFVIRHSVSSSSRPPARETSGED